MTMSLLRYDLFINVKCNLSCDMTPSYVWNAAKLLHHQVIRNTHHSAAISPPSQKWPLSYTSSKYIHIEKNLCTYMYIYIYKYEYVNTYMYIHIHIYIRIYTDIHVWGWAVTYTSSKIQSLNYFFSKKRTTWPYHSGKRAKDLVKEPCRSAQSYVALQKSPDLQKKSPVSPPRSTIFEPNSLISPQRSSISPQKEPVVICYHT